MTRRAAHAALAGLVLVASCDRPPPPESDPPSPPGDPRGRALGVRGAEISWTSGGPETWWVVERRENETGEWIRVGIRPPGTTTWRDWGLAPDATHAYRVRAATDAGLSAPCPTVEIAIPPTAIPEPRVTVHDPALVSPGWTFFNVEDEHDVISTNVVMAVDEAGRVMWQHEHRAPFASETDVLPDGDLLVQVGGAISRIDRRGDLLDYIDDWTVHHDVDVLPWGNVIAIQSVGLMEQEDTADTYSRDWILEFDPATRLTARTFHLEFMIPSEEHCPACIPWHVIGGQDWIHANAVEYDLEDEALLVSIRNLDRLYYLTWPDGDVIWTMGDGGDFGEGLFTHQHNPYVLRKPDGLAPGRMLVFDNGMHGDPLAEERSRVIEIEYDPEALAARVAWQYDGPPEFYCPHQGDARRLPNGNTLVTDSVNHRIVEVTPGGLAVWELVIPGPYFIYKAHRIENFL